jgi:hypothetical protein
VLYTISDVCAAFSLQVLRDESIGDILNLVMVQPDGGTMLKVNLPVELKGRMLAQG